MVSIDGAGVVLGRRPKWNPCFVANFETDMGLRPKAPARSAMAISFS